LSVEAPQRQVLSPRANFLGKNHDLEDHGFEDHDKDEGVSFRIGENAGHRKTQDLNSLAPTPEEKDFLQGTPLR